jgi:pimeloyl-ACP methyl ester carboxylesterase
MIYFDQRGRWSALERHGWLARVASFHDTGPNIAVLSVDLRGWGDTAPAAAPGDLADWGGADRWIAYMSAAAGEPVFVQRIHDARIAMDFAIKEFVGCTKVLLGGWGLGANVAGFVAALDERVQGVVLMDFLASFESLITTRDPVWPHDAYFPEVLKVTDFPELIGGLVQPVLMYRPLDGVRCVLPDEEAQTLFPVLPASKRVIGTATLPAMALNEIIAWIRGQVNP